MILQCADWCSKAPSHRARAICTVLIATEYPSERIYYIHSTILLPLLQTALFPHTLLPMWVRITVKKKKIPRGRPGKLKNNCYFNRICSINCHLTAKYFDFCYMIDKWIIHYSLSAVIMNEVEHLILIFHRLKRLELS